MHFQQAGKDLPQAQLGGGSQIAAGSNTQEEDSNDGVVGDVLAPDCIAREVNSSIESVYEQPSISSVRLERGASRWPPARLAKMVCDFKDAVTAGMRTSHASSRTRRSSTEIPERDRAREDDGAPLRVLDSMQHDGLVRHERHASHDSASRVEGNDEQNGLANLGAHDHGSTFRAAAAPTRHARTKLQMLRRSTSPKLVPPSDDIQIEMVHAEGLTQSRPTTMARHVSPHLLPYPRAGEGGDGDRARSMSELRSRGSSGRERKGRGGGGGGQDGTGVMLEGYGPIGQAGGILQGAGLAQKATAKMHVMRDVYIRSGIREAARNKCNFVLGLVAVFLSVLVVVVVETAFECTPLLFLSIAEYNVGQVDAVVSPGTWTNHRFLNFSKVRDHIGAIAAAGAGLGGKGESKGNAADRLLFNYSAPRHSFPETSVWAAHPCNTSQLNPLDRMERYFGRDWREADNSCAQTPWVDQSNCMTNACGPPSTGALFVIDSNLESRMGLGQRWKLGPVPYGRIYLQQSLAHRLMVQEGDMVVIKMQVRDLVEVVASTATSQNLGGVNAELYKAATHVMLALQVDTVFEEGLGKFDHELTDIMVIEYPHFFGMVSDAMVPGAERLSADFARTDSYALAQTINFNFPPPRVGAYMSHDYGQVRANVLKFVGRLSAILGYDKVQVSMTLLRELQELRVVSMFLSLVINLIVTALSALLVLLIYSLLIVSVETRAFDLGVSRMVGMTRRGLVQLLLAQTLVQSVPGWALGLFVGRFVAVHILNQLSEMTKAELPLALDAKAVVEASLMGLVVPLIAAILPIRRALGTDLNDALDITRNRVSAVTVTVTRAADEPVPLPLVCGAAVMATFGGMIYYLMPLALVSFDLTLMLYIFFGLLVGMLAGLTMLSLNLERPLEHLLASVFLFWTGEATRTSMHKNLVAHRARNRKTTIMYALSLAFILFVIVTLSLQIMAFEMQEKQLMGTPVRLYCPPYAQLDHAEVDRLVQKNAHIHDAAYVSHTLQRLMGQRTYIKNLGRIYSHRNDVYAVSPNADQVIDRRFLLIRQQRSGVPWSLTDDLYSVRGSQSVILGSLFQSSMGLGLNSSLLLQMRTDEAPLYAHLRPLAFLDGMGTFWQSPHPTADRQDALVSFPTMARLLRQRTGDASWQSTDIPILYVLFKLEQGLSEVELDAVVDDMKKLETLSGCLVQDVRKKLGALQTAKQAMDLIAGATTAVALLICFFSLTSSMIANMAEQTKEIGLLRALGVTRSWIARLYCLEALVLVLSAAVLGLGIGTFVAFTVTAQRALFTQLPLPFTFPTAPMLAILIASVVSAVLAAYVPARRLLRRNVVGLLRSV